VKASSTNLLPYQPGDSPQHIFIYRAYAHVTPDIVPVFRTAVFSGVLLCRLHLLNQITTCSYDLRSSFITRDCRLTITALFSIAAEVSVVCSLYPQTSSGLFSAKFAAIASPRLCPPTIHPPFHIRVCLNNLSSCTFSEEGEV
jgi:hypothetical protein